ncbi:hypothetical protein NL676_036920 [Syzygium grande]|nr:hypothetical protein NL676_036920 [Syzygium grande]
MGTDTVTRPTMRLGALNNSDRCAAASCSPGSAHRTGVRHSDIRMKGAIFHARLISSRPKVFGPASTMMESASVLTEFMTSLLSVGPAEKDGPHGLNEYNESANTVAQHSCHICLPSQLFLAQASFIDTRQCKGLFFDFERLTEVSPGVLFAGAIAASLAKGIVLGTRAGGDRLERGDQIGAMVAAVCDNQPGACSSRLEASLTSAPNLKSSYYVSPAAASTR